MSFLKIEDKSFLITGVANKKSVAYFTAKTLIENGAHVVFSVQNKSNLEKTQKLFPGHKIYICDVESETDPAKLTNDLKADQVSLDGFVHSIAFANFSEGPKPFHETKPQDFLQATQISCFSLTTLANALKPILKPDASVVTISISNTRATSYGYLGPIKAALDASVSYLAKSLNSGKNPNKCRF